MLDFLLVNEVNNISL